MEKQQAYTVIMEDDALHSESKPFCYGDNTCPCHSDPDNINDVMQNVENGLMTMDEAENYVAGRTL